MKSARHEARRVGALVVIVVAIGCGSDQVKVYPVHGRITFEGKPLLGGGAIALVPLGNQPGKTAGGEIAADGTYQLTTYRQGDGSMAGEFRVVITQVVETEPEPAPDGEKGSKPVTVVPPADRIPAIYSDHQKSPLRARVEASRSNEIDFDLKRNPQPPEPPIRGAMSDGRLRDAFAWLKP